MREALQRIGDGMRAIDREVWIRKAMASIAGATSEVVVATDVRYANEIEALLGLHTSTTRVVRVLIYRPGLPPSLAASECQFAAALRECAAGPSRAGLVAFGDAAKAQAGALFDFVLFNDRNHDDLAASAEELLAMMRGSALGKNASLFDAKGGGEVRSKRGPRRRAVLGDSARTRMERAALLESVRHGAAEGEPPPRPPRFDASYRPPAHRTKRLETLFPHERDALIVFHELPHVYVVAGRCMNLSVTTLAGEHAEHFVEDEAIEKMKTSRREAWPKKKYALDARPLAEGEPLPDEHAGVLVVGAASGATLAAGVPIDRSRARAEMLAASRQRNKANEEVETFSYARAMTDHEIKAAWEDNRVDGSNRGTEAHLQMELWANSEPCRVDEDEVRTGLRFVASQLAPLGVTAYRTELEIFATAEGIAGSVDFVGRLPSGGLVIVDWKRCGKLKDDVVSPFRKKMLPPLAHLESCAGAKYTLQLSIYAWILEKYHGETVEGLALCSLHPEHAFHTWMPYLKAEVEYLMHTCRAREAALQRAGLDAEAEGLACCAHEGEVLHDGVRAPDGRLFNRKPYQVHHPGEPFEEATAETARVRAYLARVEAATSREEEALAACPSWRKQVSASGTQAFRDCRAF